MKRFVLALSVALFASLCFAGTLHLRVMKNCYANCWVCIDMPIPCTFETSQGACTVFRKPDGRSIIVGYGQEWWYEE